MRPRIIIAFFTGQSDPQRCALSPEQDFFLSQLEGPARECVRINFPYAPTIRFRDTSLLRASWNNIRQYISSRSPGFAARYINTVSALIERAEHTVLLAGSCGLELFNNLRLPRELESRCTLLCYGPVARRLPRHARVVLVQGSRDFISRAFFRPSCRRIHCGHMEYLRDPEFLRICRDQLPISSPTSCISTFR